MHAEVLGGALGTRQRDVAGAPEVSRLVACTASAQPSPTRQIDYCACREAIMIASLEAHRSIGNLKPRFNATKLHESNHHHSWRDDTAALSGMDGNFTQLPNSGTYRSDHAPSLRHAREATGIAN